MLLLFAFASELFPDPACIYGWESGGFAVYGFVGLNEYPVAPFLYVFTVVAVVL
jgi:hypothetical protein